MTTVAKPEIRHVVNFTSYDKRPDQIIVTLQEGETIEEYMAINHTGATNVTSKQEEVTAWGMPITQRNQVTGKFDVFLYGDWSHKIATDLADIAAVGKWARNKDGELGAIKHHCVIGRYREVFLPN